MIDKIKKFLGNTRELLLLICSLAAFIASVQQFAANNSNKKLSEVSWFGPIPVALCILAIILYVWAFTLAWDKRKAKKEMEQLQAKHEEEKQQLIQAKEKVKAALIELGGKYYPFGNGMCFEIQVENVIKFSHILLKDVFKLRTEPYCDGCRNYFYAEGSREDQVYTCEECGAEVKDQRHTDRIYRAATRKMRLWLDEWEDSYAQNSNC